MFSISSCKVYIISCLSDCMKMLFRLSKYYKKQILSGCSIYLAAVTVWENRTQNMFKTSESEPLHVYGTIKKPIYKKSNNQEIYLFQLVEVITLNIHTQYVCTSVTDHKSFSSILAIVCQKGMWDILTYRVVSFQANGLTHCICSETEPVSSAVNVNCILQLSGRDQKLSFTSSAPPQCVWGVPCQRQDRQGACQRYRSTAEYQGEATRYNAVAV